MLTLPKIVERPAQSYVGVAANVTIPFGPAIGPAMGAAAGYLAEQGREHGPAIFRYTLIDMPRLGIEFGFLIDNPPAGNGKAMPGVLPAGRYATVTYLGHYDNLQQVTGTLIGWGRENGVEWDSTPAGSGETFVSRFELYPNGPDDEPDPEKWETQIFIKVRD